MKGTISKENIKPTKIAYLIISPESTGNKMMDKAIQSSNDFGRGGTTGNLYKSPSNWDYNWVDTDINDINNVLRSIKNAPDKVLMTCSIPRKPYPSKDWIPIGRVCKEFLKNDYKIFPIMIKRIEEFVLLSQVRRGHAPDKETAKILLNKATNYIKSELNSVGLYPVILSYELFVEEKDYRDRMFKSIFLNPAEMEFFNANNLYYRDENGVYKYRKRIRK